MKEWFKKVSNVFAWAIGVIIVIAAICTGAYFYLGWNKKKTNKGENISEGDISNLNSKFDKLHNNEICGAINSLWKDSR